MDKLLTIGVAVYNIKEEYLRGCIKSVTMNRGENIEILIIDDCYDESCSEICRKCCEGDSRITYIKNERNMGISAVRNMIIDMASGEWVAFVDGDDLLSPNFAAAVNILKDSGRNLIIFNKQTFYRIPPEGASVCRSQDALECILPNAKQLYDMALSAINRKALTDGIADGVMLNPGAVCSVAYKKDYLTDGEFRFNTDLKTAEDSLFSAAVLSHTPNAVICPEVMYYYRLNQYSVTHRYDENSKAVTDAYLKAIRDFIKENLKYDSGVMADFKTYRCIYAITDNFERNIFHKDNPNGYERRKKDFLNLLNSSPYRAAIESANPMTYSVYVTRLKVYLAKKRWFFMLDMCFKHNILFRLYGGAARRINDFKRRIKR